MGRQKYQDALLQSMSIIAENSVKKAQYDKTIQATIVKCVDPTIQQYQVKYQDSHWYAYGNGAGIAYPVGSNVYILVPKGDMSQIKTILGTVEKLGINYVNPIAEENKYEETGNNVAESLIEGQEFGLCSYKTIDSIVLYGGKKDKITINNTTMKQYIRTATHICCSFDIRTNLNFEQRYKGKYGIRFTIEVTDKTTQAKTNITRTYTIDTDVMTGNPYLFSTPINQKIFLQIDETNANNFQRISKVELFSEGFPITSKEQKPADIFFSNISFQGMKRLTQEEMNTVALSFVAKKGYIFQTNTTLKELPIQAVVRANGKVVNNASQNIKYYWFIKNIGVTASSPEYTKEGGQGWLCLNSYKKVGNNREYNSGKKNFTVKIEDVKTEETVYKCVIIYGDSKFSKTFKIINKNAKYVIKITSNKGTEFQYGIGTPTLTCQVKNENKNVTSGIAYIWSVSDKTGVSTPLTASGNQIEYDVKNIIGFNTISCTVCTEIKGKLGDVIGTAEITLVNKKTSDGGFTLLINNGQQVFNYNEQGLSPCKNKTVNFTIPNLSFTLYDKKGQIVPLQNIPKQNITWSRTNTSSNSAMIESLTFNDKRTQAYYTIRDYYRSNTSHDNIRLRVIYAGYELTAMTNFLFTRQGYAGTNGTGIVARINVEYNSNVVNNNYVPIIYKNSRNFTRLIAQLWVNGEKINTSKITTVWSILKNPTEETYIRIKQETEENGKTITYLNSAIVNRLKDAESGDVIPISQYKQNFSNIVQVTIIYGSKRYYATLPIITADQSGNNYKIYLKENTGFDEVLYMDDGTYPSYTNRPFSFVIVDDDNNAVTENTHFYYIDNDNSGTKNGETLKLVNIGQNNTWEAWMTYGGSYNYTPSQTFDGQNTAKYINCKAIITNKDKKITNTFYINVPIYHHLNLYGHAAINEWNGNSIQINDKHDIILSPQIGAGGKDKDTNSFTGIVMGTVKDSKGTHTGLFGYGKGAQSIFLDAKTGNATFGQRETGQIVITPKSGTITGGDYNWSSKTSGDDRGKGMQINLGENPYIRFGSQKFYVTSEGKLYAQGGGEIAGWSIGNEDLSKVIRDKNKKIITSVGMSSNPIDAKNPKKYNFGNRAFWAGDQFRVDFDGNARMTSCEVGGNVYIKKGTIYSGEHTKLDSAENGFFLSQSGISLGENFKVTSTGKMLARSGYIGNSTKGFTITDNAIANGKSTAEDKNNGIYLGVDAIALGPKQNFYVDNTGALISRKGKIGGWNIAPNAIYNDDVTNVAYGDKDGVYKRGIYFGSGGLRMGEHFHVDSSGNLYANNGHFEGYLKTGEGEIAKWEIKTDRLKGGNIEINSNGSMKGSKWNIDTNGKATFSDINVTGGNWKNGTISGGSRTGGSISGGSISPNGVGVSGYRNLQDWCNSSADKRIKALYAELVDANYLKSKIGDINGLKVKSLSCSAAIHTERLYASDNIYLNGKSVATNSKLDDIWSAVNSLKSRVSALQSKGK